MAQTQGADLCRRGLQFATKVSFNESFHHALHDGGEMFGFSVGAKFARGVIGGR